MNRNLNENKIKHLELIQTVITRMNTNSFQIKELTITISVALIALYASNEKLTFIFIAIFPTLIFWFLDAYYLQQERKFRGLYNDIAGLTIENKKSVCLFDMSIEEYTKDKDKKYGYRNVFFSKTLTLFYLPQIIVLLITGLLLSGIGEKIIAYLLASFCDHQR